MKKIFALALAIVMMMAIALPTFADVKNTDTAAGVQSEHKYGQLHSAAASEQYTKFDSMDIKYGVYQEYIITIPADVNFGFLDPATMEYKAERTVSADHVIISGDEYLVITVDSANKWQMKDMDGKSVNVDYTAKLNDNPLTYAATAEAKDAISYTNTSADKTMTVLVVDHAKGNEGFEAWASGDVVIEFTTAGTAQEGTYLDTLTFTVDVTDVDPVTGRPAQA